MRAIPLLAAAALLLACGGGGSGSAPGDDGGGADATADDAGNEAGADACAGTVCAGQCVDTGSDGNNCGSCGKACVGDEVCVAGACALACSGGQTPCAGHCVDTSTDPTHCGSCGTPCTAPQICAAGTCTPPGTVVFTVAGGASQGAPAIDASGAVYAVGTDGFVRAFDALGKPQWKSSASVGAGRTTYYTIGGVALGPSQTYVGGPDGNLYSFDMTGKLLWKVSVGGDLTYATPAVGGAKLGGAIVAAGRGTAVAAIDPGGSVKWTYTLGGAAYSSSPAVAPDGTTYIATWDDQNVYAIDHAGKLSWKSSNGGGAVTSPAIGQDGTIYVGNHGPSDGVFRAFKPDGTEKWGYSVGNFHGGAALDNEDTVYIGNDTMLVALKLDGTLKWQVSAGTLPIQNSGEHWVCGNNAVGDDGRVYVPVCGSWSLSVFDRTSGTLLYEVQLDGFPGPVAIGHKGLLYVGTAAGTLYAIAVAAHGPNAGSSWPKHHKDLANTGQE